MVDWFLSDNLTFTFYSAIEQGLIVVRAEANMIYVVPFRIIQIEER